MLRISKAFGALLALVAVAAVPGLSAQQVANLYDKFQINLSITNVHMGSNIRVDGSNGEGTDIDAENDLGLDANKIQPRFSLRWRMGHRHELEVGYQFARRNAEKTLARDISFADSTYHLGADVKATFNTDQVFLTYRFAFMAKDRTQIGVGLGLGALLLDLGIDALASGNSNQVEFSQSKSVTGPTASLGLYGRFLAGSRWYFELDGRYIKISIDRFHPSVWEWNGAARYSLSKSFLLEAGYGGTSIDVGVDPKTTTTGRTGIASGNIKYSLQNLRFGLVWVP